MQLVTFTRESGDPISINPTTVKVVTKAHNGLDHKTPHAMLELTKGEVWHYVVRGTVESVTEAVNEGLKK
jgi:hypothetical protein